MVGKVSEVVWARMLERIRSYGIQVAEYAQFCHKTVIFCVWMDEGLFGRALGQLGSVKCEDKVCLSWFLLR